MAGEPAAAAAAPPAEEKKFFDDDDAAAAGGCGGAAGSLGAACVLPFLLESAEATSGQSLTDTAAAVCGDAGHGVRWLLLGILPDGADPAGYGGPSAELQPALTRLQTRLRNRLRNRLRLERQAVALESNC